MSHMKESAEVKADEPPADLEAAKGSLPPAIVRSELVEELRRLPDAVREQFGFVEPAFMVVDYVVASSCALIDTEDQRYWMAKLEDVINAVDHCYPNLGDGAVTSLFADFVEGDIESYLSRFPRDNFQRFFMRLVGAAAYHRLKTALRHDTASVVSAARQVLDLVAPYAAAWDDLTGSLTEEQLSAFKEVAASRGQMLGTMVALFDLLDTTLLRLDIPEELTNLATVRSITEHDIDAVRAEFRELNSGRTRAAMQELSATLSRKLAGAKDALVYSADSVSQAANSLIELTDRLLRVFSDAEVLTWLDNNYPDLQDTTYFDENGQRLRPTKRGQALCLVHAGRDVGSAAEVLIVGAVALVRTRNTLQRLKHSDEGTTEEQAQVEGCLYEVEAFFSLLTGVIWATLPDETLMMLRERLEPSTPVSGLVDRSA